MLLPDGTGAVVLTEMRNALDSLATMFKGASAPAETHIGQMYLNTSDSIVYQLQSDGITWLPKFGWNDPYRLGQKYPMNNYTITSTSIPDTGVYTACSLLENVPEEPWWVVGTPNRITIPFNGKILLHASVKFASASSGGYGISIRKNGSAFGNWDSEEGRGANLISAQQKVPLIAHIQVAATDYFEIFLSQKTGAGAITATGEFQVMRTR